MARRPSSARRHATGNQRGSGTRPQARGEAAPDLESRRAAYPEAIELYRLGLEALQQHRFSEAAERLRAVLDRFPDEKELHDRVRLYLNVCARQAGPDEPTPATREERLYAATLAMNGGQYREARRHLDAVLADDPDDDHAVYMLAALAALEGHSRGAIEQLRRAIALNPENRTLARQDPDLASLRTLDEFQEAVEAVPVRQRSTARGAKARRQGLP